MYSISNAVNDVAGDGHIKTVGPRSLNVNAKVAGCMNEFGPNEGHAANCFSNVVNNVDYDEQVNARVTSCTIGVGPNDNGHAASCLSNAVDDDAGN